jgi:enoyl-CoA hydratase/carnithine racemase
MIMRRREPGPERPGAEGAESGRLASMDVPTTLSLDTPHPGVLVLRLDRPRQLNAINEVMVRELAAACSSIGADRAVRVVVLTGTGRGFCSGIDMRDFGPGMLDATDPAIDRLRFQETMASLPQALRALPQPVIAAVNGPAVGGGLALCLAADVRICSASASFANAAILVGLSGAEMGMSYHLPRIVGTSIAADWMLTGRTVSSEEAHRSGLVSELVDDDRLMDRSLEVAVQIASHSPLAVQLTKRAIQVNTDAPDVAAALEVENRNQVIAHATEEAAAARARWSPT